MSLFGRFFDWLDRNNWTPEMRAAVERAVYEKKRGLPPSIPGGRNRYAIRTVTSYRKIPAGWKLATVPADSPLEALKYYAGASPFEQLAEDQIRFRGKDIVVAVLEREGPQADVEGGGQP